MEKLFVSSVLAEVELLKEVLEQEGISCVIKNQQGSSLAGEVPFAEVFPELWVINNDDFHEAREFLENWQKPESAKNAAWTCLKCGEVHEKNFTACWKCSEEL